MYVELYYGRNLLLTSTSRQSLRDSSGEPTLGPCHFTRFIPMGESADVRNPR